MTTQGMAGTLGEAKHWLQAVEVGDGVHTTNLTVFPLYWRGQEELASSERPPSWGSEESGTGKKMRYRLLAEAIEAKQARVEETSESGDVPLLAVRNYGAIPVLIPEGEILIGAKQNRTVNLTLLVAAKSQMQMPVSCIEAGRWHRRSRHFEAKAWAHPKLRELKMRSAQVHRREVGEARSDQSAVWREVDEQLEAFDVPAPTRDMALAFDAAEDHLGGYRKQVELPTGACGFVAARGDEVVGLDLFDAPETLQKLWARISDAYFLEAARDRDPCRKSPKKVVKQFLKVVERHLEPTGKQPELGFEMELANETLSGSALWYDGAICHLSAFSTSN